ILIGVILVKAFMWDFRISVQFNLQSVVFLIVSAVIFYAKMNYIFFLKKKLQEENEKFSFLYRTVVDEILVGKEIIDKLLPNKKGVKGLEFEKYFKPVVLVGGDFLDVIPLSDSKFIAYVADVSGHGVSAGVIVSMLKALLLKEVVRGYSNLPSVVRNLNSDFNTLVRETGRYATLFITLIDKARKKFSYVSCGHTDCLYWSSRLGEFFFLSSTAPLLGLLNNIDAYSSEIDFNENDYLILISDGIFSITNEGSQVISTEDFVSILNRYISPQIMPNELMFRVSQEIESFMERGQIVDDITMFFIKL
ncbi:MAG: SpoIIE family protein phosphatase, partial [Brevinematia bacterium]